MASIGCYISYIFHMLTFGLIGKIFSIALELVKFGVVLLLSYMLFLAFFYMWERRTTSSNKYGETAWTQNYLNRIPNGTPCDAAEPTLRPDVEYPYVVEIPSKLSIDSYNLNNEKDKNCIC